MALVLRFQHSRRHLLEAATSCRGSEMAPAWVLGSKSCGPWSERTEEVRKVPRAPSRRSASCSRRGSQRVSTYPGAPQRRKGPPTCRQSLPHVAALWTDFRGCFLAQVPPSPFVGPPAWHTPSQGFNPGSHLGSPDSLLRSLCCSFSGTNFYKEGR